MRAGRTSTSKTSAFPRRPQRFLVAVRNLSPAVALHRYGCTALHWAARYGHLPAVRALIHAGASLHIQTNGSGFAGRWDSRLGGSARTASPAGGIPAWAVGSARPNRRGSERASAAGARRTTPLHCAAYSGDAGATAALLGAGADASIEESSGCAAPSRAVPLWPHGRAAAGRSDRSRSCS